jgi:Uma2 family endonuclease
VWEDAPSVIIEVLSEGTERMDSVEKRDAYFVIPTLTTYALIDSRSMKALVMRRAGAGWKTETLCEARAVIELPEIGCRLPLAAAYEGVF